MKSIEFSVPVIVDSIKDYSDFLFSRCSYFSIECLTPGPILQFETNDFSISFIMLDLSGVIIRPYDYQKFKTKEHIMKLFDTIEKEDHFSVEVNELWLPNLLLKKARRGDVFRLDSQLFIESFKFTNNKISEKQFLEFCHIDNELCYYSEIETKSFQAYEKEIVNMAKVNYKKNREDELKWNNGKEI